MKSPNRDQIIDLLKGTRLLRGAPDAEIKALAVYVRPSTIGASETLFNKNAKASSVYFLVKGRIRIVSISRNGTEFLLGTVEAGEMFGELALVENGRRAVTATSDRESRLLSIDRRHLLPILERNPACAMALSKILAMHARSTVNKLENVALHHANRRIGLLLLGMEVRYGGAATETGSHRVNHGLTQQQLADSVGLTRVMVSRELGHFRDLNLISYGRGYVDFHDLDAFKKFVWTEP